MNNPTPSSSGCFSALLLCRLVVPPSSGPTTQKLRWQESSNRESVGGTVFTGGILTSGIQWLRGTGRNVRAARLCSRCRGLAAANTAPRPAVEISSHIIRHSADEDTPDGGNLVPSSNSL